MIRKLMSLVRLALVAAVIGCVVTPVSAAPRGQDRVTSHPTTSVEQPGDPELGLVWIGIGVAILVFMVWVAVRIGDNDR